MVWQVYLSGEIHTDWRERIERGAEEAGLDVEFTGPVTDHAASDDCGVAILGPEDSPFVVVRFGDQYRQWNARVRRRHPALRDRRSASPAPIEDERLRALAATGDSPASSHPNVAAGFETAAAL